MAEDVVILIHGVDSTGSWYQTARAALFPHFDCKPIRYSEYEHWGKLKVALDPTLLKWSVATGFLAVAFAFLNAFFGLLLGSGSLLIMCAANAFVNLIWPLLML